MARKLRSTTRADLNSICMALDRLREARGFLRDAKAGRSVAYVSRAIKSAEGAERHARNALQRPSAGDALQTA